MSTITQIVIYHLSDTSLSRSNIVTASGNLGVTLISNGVGILCLNNMEKNDEYMKVKSRTIYTHTTSPDLIQLSKSIGTATPSESFGLSMFIAQSRVAIWMNNPFCIMEYNQHQSRWRKLLRLTFATCFPTQTLLPNPYVKCPSCLMPCDFNCSASKCLSGLNSITSGPQTSGS